jgi:hypothetical protein
MQMPSPAVSRAGQLIPVFMNGQSVAIQCLKSKTTIKTKVSSGSIYWTGSFWASVFVRMLKVRISVQFSLIQSRQSYYFSACFQPWDFTIRAPDGILLLMIHNHAVGSV